MLASYSRSTDHHTETTESTNVETAELTVVDNAHEWTRLWQEEQEAVDKVWNVSCFTLDKSDQTVHSSVSQRQSLARSITVPHHQHSHSHPLASHYEDNNQHRSLPLIPHHRPSSCTHSSSTHTMSPPPSNNSLEEGTTSDSNTNSSSAGFIQRRGQISSSSSSFTSSTRSNPVPSSSHHPSSSSSSGHPRPSSSSSSSLSCCSSLSSHPSVPLLLTLVLFSFLLLVMSYSFMYLKQAHPSHHFSAPAFSSSSDLLSSHPAYVQLTRQLTTQYQQLVSLAKQYMDDDKWREFQTEAAKMQVKPATIAEVDDALISNTQTACPPCPTSPTCPTCPPSNGRQSRLSELTGAAVMTDWSVNSTAPLLPSDLTLDTSYDWRSAEHSWTYCDHLPVTVPYLGDVKLCDPSDFRLEQWFQKQQFVIPGTREQLIEKPHAPDCLWAPPPHYRFPSKHLTLPALPNSSWVHWPNHLVMNAYNLSMFNYGYSKNLYHFDAPFYDRQQMDKLDRIARHIPFHAKVRNGLDIGAGGGSLSLLLHRRYNSIILNLVYAELPYCEYITERGGLCAYITAFYSMPFAKFSFDFVHIAWLFHMHSEWSLMDKLMEVNRVLRPGGYLWWEGGFSYKQRDSVKEWAEALGYHLVWEESVDSFDGTMFGKEKHECDYTAVFRKASQGIIKCGAAREADSRGEGGGGGTGAG